MEAEKPSDDRTQSFITLASGTEVGHYQIIEKIGAGGMGEVYLAEDIELNRKVALKFLSPHLCQDEECRLRFRREAQAAAKLDHPNIITVHEVGEFNGQPFFAMKYVKGSSLSEQIRNKAFDISLIPDIALKISAALKAAHDIGIVHRDIKPSNVLIDTEGNPRLVDFGLASVKEGDNLTRAGSTLGTLGYMSPEQIEGETVDARSDLFSLGVLLYEMVTRKNPFKQDSQTATLNAILTKIPEPLTHYNQDATDAWQNIISRLLEKNPDDRYQSASEVITNLRVLVGKMSEMVRKPNTRPSIAVLPFSNLSADPEQGYFCDGISEEIINALAKNPELKVTGRTSSFAFKDKQEDLRRIGQKLGVGTLLEGSVRKAGKRVRITAQLINAADGFHLWSETYDRILEDVFSIQDDIAQSVASAMNVKLLGKQKTRVTSNFESYNLVLKANQLVRQLTKPKTETAIDLYQKAIDLDPDNASAMVGMARICIIQAAYGFGVTLGGYRHGKELVQKALVINDSLAYAYEVLGWILGAFEYRIPESGAAFQKAYSLAPNDSRIVSNLALYKGALGKFDESLPYSEAALELDPLNPEAYMNHARISLCAGKLEDSRSACIRALELSPGMTSINMALAFTYLLQGRLGEALSAAEREEVSGYRYCGLALVYHAMKKKQEADAALKKLLSQGDEWGFQFAMVYAYRNETDKAFERLEKAVELRDPGLPMTKVSPFMSNLHSDPRWPVLLKKIGLAD